MLAYLVPALPLIGLFVAAAVNETIEYRQHIDRVRLYLNDLQLHRIDRNWKAITEIPFEVPDEKFHVAKDLDLFGKASLFKLICLAQTPLGIQRLGDWFLNPTSPDEIKRRQHAVAELKDNHHLREELQLLSHTVSKAQTEPEELLDWANGELWLEPRKWLLWLGRISAITVLLSGIWFLFPGSPKMILGVLLMALVGIHIVLTVVYAGSIHAIFNSVGYRQRDVSTYVDLFRLAKSLSTNSELLNGIQQDLVTGKKNAVACVGQLQAIIGIAQMRRSGLMFLVYILLQFLFLVDVHTLNWLESWHKKYARRVGDWLEAVATWEALSSLSNLAYHQPDWSFPVVESACKSSQQSIEAKSLGHPLLPDDQRVCNDVTVGPRDSILLVTGSNMSGKSTLLRSIGMNCALAQAGSVVCSSEMKMPAVQIETSMRIGDSVSDGISFFMAELKRLREITVEAESLAEVSNAEREADDGNNRMLLFLLDEILQGTNSKERQIAVIRVCEYLLDSGAIGAISTHDLELAEAEGLKQKCQTVHFREFFEDGVDGKKEMSFDYVMRQGVSPTTNALKLLELVGLSDREHNDQSSDDEDT